jgi:hypothetical protein
VIEAATQVVTPDGTRIAVQHSGAGAPLILLSGQVRDELNPTVNAPLIADRIPGARLQLIERGREPGAQLERSTTNWNRPSTK